MRRALVARRPRTIAPGRISCPGGLLGAVALIVTLAGCGERVDADKHGGIVVVSGGSEPTANATGTPDVALASTASDPATAFTPGTIGTDEPVEDPAAEAALTAAREADPYRLGGVDPEVLAQAAAAG